MRCAYGHEIEYKTDHAECECNSHFSKNEEVATQSLQARTMDKLKKEVATQLAADKELIERVTLAVINGGEYVPLGVLGDIRESQHQLARIAREQLAEAEQQLGAPLR
jgi:hypothetical protein